MLRYKPAAIRVDRSRRRRRLPRVKRFLFISASILLVGQMTFAADKKAMPKEDVIEFPSIGKGLSIHNLFQSNFFH